MGDTHGQYFDLIHLLKLTGLPSDKHMMLFNGAQSGKACAVTRCSAMACCWLLPSVVHASPGDFVDRGSWSTEVVIVLFALKWLYPDRVWLSRGNHETSDMCVGAGVVCCRRE